MLTQEQRDLIALRIVGEHPVGLVTAHRIIEETLRCVGEVMDNPARPPKVYRCCAKHEGQQFTLKIGYAASAVAVCPHCEPPSDAGVEAPDGKGVCGKDADDLPGVKS